MFQRFVLISGLIGAGLMFADSASAQGLEDARQEFLDRCAVCHGDEGAGDGPVGDMLAHKPRNLQLIEQENGYVFPYEDVYNAIRGNVDVPAHGYSDMPIWGKYLMEEALEEHGLNPKEAADIVHGRILQLVFYIASIQNEDPDAYEEEYPDDELYQDPDQ